MRAGGWVGLLPKKCGTGKRAAAAAIAEAAATLSEDDAPPTYFFPLPRFLLNESLSVGGRRALESCVCACWTSAPAMLNRVG